MWRPRRDRRTSRTSANIATWTGRTQKWDPIKEEFIGDDMANRMRQRAMRAPWTV